MRHRLRFLGMNMALRSHRRGLVSTVYVVLVAAWATVLVSGSNRGVPLLLLVTIVNGFVLGGYGRRGLIKPFLSHPASGAASRNDEREIERRDRMHFHAYRWVVVLLLLGVALGEPPFQHAQLGRSLLLLGMVLGPTLPQAMLLWSEPDVELEEPDAPHRGHPSTTVA